MSERYPEYPPDTVSVTEVLHAVGLIEDRWYTEESRERGTVVHSCCQLLAQGLLDWETVDERIIGYVQSYARLLETTGWLAELTESKIYDSAIKICGTFDLSFNGGAIADIKTGAPQPWHELQLGFYWHLAGRGRGNCYGVYLQGSGEIARLKSYGGFDAWRKAQIVLNFFNLKRGMK